MADNHLSQAEIELILEGMTARDIFAAMPSGTATSKGAEIAGDAFERAAERQGYGSLALDRVRPGDATFLAGKLGEVFDQGSPKSDSGVDLPTSSDTGA